MSVSVADLIEARLQAHYAAQLVASLGGTFLGPTSDDSHPNLEWSRERKAVVGRSVPLAGGISAALRLADLQVSLLGSDQRELAALPLDGLSLADGYAQLADAVSRLAKRENLLIRPTSYALPSHDLERAGKFDATQPGLEPLASAYDLAAEVLEETRVENQGASEVRCWPHHFDLATLISLEGEQSIGVGFSPGDETYAEPYWYVTPWPYPAAADLPVLGAGHWHTDGFTGAILTRRELAASAKGADRKAASRAFVADALSASRRSLAAGAAS